MKSFWLTIILALTFTGVTARADDNVRFKWLREIRYEQIRPYSNGMSAFKHDGRWGYINTKGEVVIQPIYDECKDFKDGITIACKKGKWGVINKQGKCLSGFIFDAMNQFSDDYAYASSGENVYYVAKDGTVKALSNDFSYGNFTEGMAPVKNKKKNKWGFIDKKGHIVIETKYDTVYNFSNGIAMAVKKGEPVYINKKDSKKSINLFQKQPLNFINGYAKVKTSDGFGFMNKDMKLLPIKVKEATEFNENGMAAVLLPDKTMKYIDGRGHKVLDVNYDRVGNFYHGLAWVNKNGKYGYIDEEGKLVIDTLFTSATDFNDSVAFVSMNGRFGSIKIKDKQDYIPELNINDIKIRDANENGKVEAEEVFNIFVNVTNPTREDLRDVVVEFAGNQDIADGFEFRNFHSTIPVLRAGADTVISFNGNAKLSLMSEDIDLKFRGSADNLFIPVEKDFSFEAIGINACRPVISRYWVYKNNHTVIEPGDEVNMNLTISNTGKDLAKDVNINLQWPEGTIGEEDNIKIPLLRPGEVKEIKTTFVVDSTNAESMSKNVFTVVAKLSEYTKKHNDIKYLSYNTGQMNAEINLEGGATPMFQYGRDAQNYASNISQNTPQIVTEGGDSQAIGKVVEEKSELLEGIKLVNQPNNNKYALVIGNEDYNSYKLTASYEVNVEHAVQDANVFAEYAKDYMGVPEENIILLRNATYAQMSFNLNKLMMMSKTNKGNVELYIFYAGHGQHDVDSKETYLIPIDVSIASPTAGIKLDKIYADLGSCGAKRAMVFMDACYSGVGRGIVIKPKEAPVKGNVLVLTATSSTQRSMPYKEKKHGLFTYYLLKTIKEANGNINMYDLYQEVRQKVVKNSIWVNNSEQTPELINGEGIDNNWKYWNIY